MGQVTKICIGIQARSNSSRFPGKIFELIGGIPMINHVIDACDMSALYLNRNSRNAQEMVQVSVLFPEGDEGVRRVRPKAVVYEGPEQDVLARYKLMADRQGADYIVRITSDCPLIPPPLITKHIKTAIMNQYDYVSNVDESLRTSMDGFDVEVISKRALEWLDENATDAQDREHVTLKIRREPPDWAKVGHVVGYVNQSHLKLSVDTQDDLERVRAQYETIKRAIDSALKKHGRGSVHRF